MVRTATATDLVVCTTSFVGSLRGVDVACRAGELLELDDPIVKNWPSFFQRPEATRRSIEQATAAPGEKRGR